MIKELIDNLLKLQALQFDETADADLGNRIEKLRAKIPAQVLGHYDRLAARGKKGVAAVRNQVCTGCHVQVPLGVTVTLMHGDDIQICENCGRYLYLAPAVETKTVPAPKAEKAPKGGKHSAGKRSAELQTA
jgi:predicted  nucleic acid-binding Zn-ribbon protein